MKVSFRPPDLPPFKPSAGTLKLMREVSDKLRTDPKRSIKRLDFMLMWSYSFVYSNTFRFMRTPNLIYGLTVAFIFMYAANRIDDGIADELTSLAKLLGQNDYSKGKQYLFATTLGFLTALMESAASPARLPIISFAIDISVLAIVLVGALVYAARYCCDYCAGGGVTPKWNYRHALLVLKASATLRPFFFSRAALYEGGFS